MRSLRTPVLAALAAGSLVALAGCGGSDNSAEGSNEDFTVVTSTNVYADIVKNVAGDAAEVTPVIDDPTQDPHDYEATAQDQLKLSKADMVVVNGGGYDAFMTTMLEAADHKPTVVDTVAISGLPGSEGVANEPHDHDHGDEDGHDHGEEGHDHGTEEAHDHGTEDAHDHGEEGHEHHDHGTEDAHDHGEDAHDHGEEGHDHDHDHGEEGHDHDHDHGAFNEHVWYSVPTMTKLVDEVSSKLSDELPDSADDIKKNAEDYKAELGKLQSQLDEAKSAHDGEKAAATEPIALWLFHDMGIENITSQDFLSAVEHGDDVPPLVLKKAKEQIANKEVVVLAYNSQNAGPQADELKTTAESAGVPVVSLAETMDNDEKYIDWMGGYIKDVQEALAGHDH
ncbi:zinc ABC transporter substrate-binding protein [Brevibacterium luteolum]|uniref:metal ABC transporter solute-binding protein, Zn/Mn family n=1 Tax=Brevibacterium luteolum TaxID=199591 RepID=UPI0021B08DA3|nr:zinc ABC transporter substrate-binding protein [Brevibacterium luteolum]MCT1920832.1 zinc ABC transporter substrate-binding protein [Brevibacterium luteolum]